ncbi:restriction endonuclease subunit S [Bacteroides thetaiotaomicron]|nr:restriction endonuclease subunit S [Bacteroides thetaiotaomicron]
MGTYIPNKNQVFLLDDSNNKYFLKEGDLLFSAKGANNFCTIFHTQKYNAVASSSFLIIRIRDKKRILPDYLCWFFNRQTTLQYLTSNAKGTSIPSISKSTVEELNIPILPVDKQEKIIAIAKLQKTEERLYKKIIRKREQLTEYKLKNIISNGN